MIVRTYYCPCPEPDECNPHPYMLLLKMSFNVPSLQALRPKYFYTFVISSKHATFLHSLLILFSMIQSPFIHVHSADIKMCGLYLYSPTCLCGILVGEPLHYRFFPTFCYFFTPRPKCCSQLTVLEHPQPTPSRTPV